MNREIYIQILYIYMKFQANKVNKCDNHDHDMFLSVFLSHTHFFQIFRANFKITLSPEKNNSREK